MEVRTPYPVPERESPGVTQYDFRQLSECNAVGLTPQLSVRTEAELVWAFVGGDFFVAITKEIGGVQLKLWREDLCCCNLSHLRRRAEFTGDFGCALFNIAHDLVIVHIRPHKIQTFSATTGATVETLDLNDKWEEIRLAAVSANHFAISYRFNTDLRTLIGRLESGTIKFDPKNDNWQLSQLSGLQEYLDYRRLANTFMCHGHPGHFEATEFDVEHRPVPRGDPKAAKCRVSFGPLPGSSFSAVKKCAISKSLLNRRRPPIEPHEAVEIAAEKVENALVVYFPVLVSHRDAIARFRDGVGVVLYRPPAPDRLIDVQIQNTASRYLGKLSLFSLECLIERNVGLLGVVAESPLIVEYADHILNSRLSALDIPGVQAGLGYADGKLCLIVVFRDEDNVAQMIARHLKVKVLCVGSVDSKSEEVVTVSQGTLEQRGMWPTESGLKFADSDESPLIRAKELIACYLTVKRLPHIDAGVVVRFFCESMGKEKPK
jgi:hypothetical protein